LSITLVNLDDDDDDDDGDNVIFYLLLNFSYCLANISEVS